METEEAEPVAPPEGEAPEPNKIPDDPTILRAELEKVRKEAAGYRTKAKELEPLAQRAKELEDAQKSESEKLAERIAEAEKARDDAERRALYSEVRATRPDLSPTQVARLQGENVDDLLADADEVYGTQSTDEPTGPKRRPSELVPGAVPGAEPEPDYDAIADRIRRW